VRFKRLRNFFVYSTNKEESLSLEKANNMPKISVSKRGSYVEKGS
jgi:hypothetical protein